MDVGDELLRVGLTCAAALAWLLAALIALLGVRR